MAIINTKMSTDIGDKCGIGLIKDRVSFLDTLRKVIKTHGIKVYNRLGGDIIGCVSRINEIAKFNDPNHEYVIEVESIDKQFVDSIFLKYKDNSVAIPNISFAIESVIDDSVFYTKDILYAFIEDEFSSDILCTCNVATKNDIIAERYWLFNINTKPGEKDINNHIIEKESFIKAFQERFEKGQKSNIDDDKILVLSPRAEKRIANETISGEKFTVSYDEVVGQIMNKTSDLSILGVRFKSILNSPSSVIYNPNEYNIAFNKLCKIDSLDLDNIVYKTDKIIFGYFKNKSENKKKEMYDMDNVTTIDPLKNKIVESQFQLSFLRPVKIRYHFEKYPNMVKIKEFDQGDYIDLACAEDVSLKAGEFKFIPLGISTQLPEGYIAKLYPRSSTFKNYGILLANSVGIIDESYCGDDDLWYFPACCTRDIDIKAGERIAQFTIEKKINIKIQEVEKLNNENRGGLGSTGKE